MPQAHRAKPHVVHAVRVGTVAVVAPRVANQPTVRRVQRDEVGLADSVSEALARGVVVYNELVETRLLGQPLAQKARFASAQKGRVPPLVEQLEQQRVVRFE